MIFLFTNDDEQYLQIFAEYLDRIYKIRLDRTWTLLLCQNLSTYRLYYFVNSLINFAVLGYLLFLVLVRLDHVSIDIVSNYIYKKKYTRPKIQNTFLTYLSITLLNINEKMK